jgi:hypothetical protein
VSTRGIVRPVWLKERKFTGNLQLFTKAQNLSSWNQNTLQPELHVTLNAPVFTLSASYSGVTHRFMEAFFLGEVSSLYREFE